VLLLAEMRRAEKLTNKAANNGRDNSHNYGMSVRTDWNIHKKLKRYKKVDLYIFVVVN